MFIGGACSRPYRVDPPRAKKLRGNSTARGSKCALAVFRRWAHRAARRKAAHPPWGCPIGRPWVWEHPRLPQHGATREHNAPPERLSGSRRASQIHPEYTGSTPNTWVYTRTPGCTPRCGTFPTWVADGATSEEHAAALLKNRLYRRWGIKTAREYARIKIDGLRLVGGNPDFTNPPGHGDDDARFYDRQQAYVHAAVRVCPQNPN